MTTVHDERYYYQQQQQFLPMDEIDNDPFIAEALRSMWQCHTSMIEEVESLRAIDEEIEACQREALKLEQQLMQNTTRVGMELLDRVKHIPEAWDMVLQAHEMIQESWLRETGDHYTSNVYEGQFASSYDTDMLRKWLSNFIREVLQQPNVDDAWQRIGSTKFRPYFAGAHKIFLRCLIKERIAIDDTFSIAERLKMYAADVSDDSSTSKKKEEASADATTMPIYPSLPAIPRDDDNLEKQLPILPPLSSSEQQQPQPSTKKKTTDLNRFVTRAKRIKKKQRITTTMRIGTDSRDISKRPLTALEDDDDEEEEEEERNEDADAAMESGQEDEEEEEASEDDESDEDEDEDEDEDDNDLDAGELDDLMKDAAAESQSQQEDQKSSAAAAQSPPPSQEPESPRPPSPQSPPPPPPVEEAEAAIVPETLNYALQNSMQQLAAMLVAASRQLQEIQVDRNGVYIQQQLYASCTRIWETLQLQMVGFRREQLENVDDQAKISFSIQAMIGIAFIAYSPAAVASNDLLSSMLQRINQADPADQTQANLIFSTLQYAARKTILNDALLLMRPHQQQRDFTSVYAADVPTTVQDNIAAIITRYLENNVLYDVRYVTLPSSQYERDAWVRENDNTFIPVPELLLVPWITKPEEQLIVSSYRDRPADSETVISKASMVTLQYALEQLVDDYYTRELANPNRMLPMEMPMLRWMIDMAALILMHRLRSDTKLLTETVLGMRWTLQRYGRPTTRPNTGAISFVFPLDKWDELRGHLLSPLLQHYRQIRGVMTQYKISFTRRLAQQHQQVPFEHLPLRTPLAIFSVLYRYWMQEMNFERFEPHVHQQQQQALPRWTIAEMEYIATRQNTGIRRLGIADRLLLLIQDVAQDGIVHRAELPGAFEYMEQRLFESIRAQQQQQQQQQQ